MLTLFTIPKPFESHINIIQRNAIKSWSCLRPKCEIVLCGDDAGAKEVAKEFDVKWIRDISRNEFGTPLLSSAFQKVKNIASNDLMCYVNSDIILLSDFILSIKRINIDNFLVIGSRWDIDISERINFNENNWEMKIKERIKLRGSRHPPMGADYFVFKKGGALSDIPPFAVGRPLWDNWFIYNARKNKYKVIDASNVIMAIHQNHEYSHLLRDYCRKKGQLGWESPEGPEVDKQRGIMNGDEKCFKLVDATHILTENGLKRAMDYQHLNRRFHTLPVFYPRLEPVIEFIDRNLVANKKKYRKKKLQGLV